MMMLMKSKVKIITFPHQCMLIAALWCPMCPWINKFRNSAIRTFSSKPIISYSVSTYCRQSNTQEMFSLFLTITCFREYISEYVKSNGLWMWCIGEFMVARKKGAVAYFRVPYNGRPCELISSCLWPPTHQASVLKTFLNLLFVQ